MNSNNTEHINNRRTPHQELETKKRRTVQFQDQEKQDDSKDDKEPSTVSKRRGRNQ